MNESLAKKAFAIKTGSWASKIVLVRLAWIANDNCICSTTYAELASYCGISKRTAGRYIEILELSGFICKLSSSVSGEYTFKLTLDNKQGAAE